MSRTNGLVYLASAAAVMFVLASGAQAGGTVGSLKDGVVAAPTEDYAWSGLYGGVGIGVGRFGYDVDVDASKKTNTKIWEREKKKDLVKVCKDVVVNECQKECTPGGSHEKCNNYTKFNLGQTCKDVCKPKVVQKCRWKKVYNFTDWTTTTHTSTDTASSHHSGDDWNVFGTVQVGYDRVVRDRFLIGAFADLDLYGGSGSSFSGPLGTLGSVKGSLELDNVWNFGGRIGYLATPRLLLYAAGGYTQASLDGSVDVSFDGGPTYKLKAPNELHGYFVGGGGEYKLDRNLSLKLEYRWSAYGSASDSASGQELIDLGCTSYVHHHCTQKKEIVKEYKANADFDLDIHSVRANLVWKFDRPEAPTAALK
jgi:opacity protein-like surface antigen